MSNPSLSNSELLGGTLLSYCSIEIRKQRVRNENILLLVFHVGSLVPQGISDAVLWEPNA